eukprot:1973493-Amphidinium_carterae.1
MTMMMRMMMRMMIMMRMIDNSGASEPVKVRSQHGNATSRGWEELFAVANYLTSKHLQCNMTCVLVLRSHHSYVSSWDSEEQANVLPQPLSHDTRSSQVMACVLWASQCPKWQARVGWY